MATRSYHGSCHCRAVTFEADIDLDQGTGKCNCTICWKQRMWNAGQLKPGDLRILTGEDVLAAYGRSGDRGEGHHRFCARCGIATHSHGTIAAMGGDFVSVHLAALDDLPVDDLPVDDLVAAPLAFMDGWHDAWWQAPAETRHL